MGEIGCVLPSQIVRKELVRSFIALAHLSSHMGTQWWMHTFLPGGSSSDCCWCHCSRSLPRLQLFAEQSLNSSCSLISFLLHYPSYNSGCWLSLHSKSSLVFNSSRLLAFFFFHAGFGLLPPLVQHRLTASERQCGEKKSCTLSCTLKGFLPLMLRVTVRP